MESPVTGRPNRETGLPPGVEVGPLGRRFVAFLINMSVPVVVSLALLFLLPATSGALRMTLAMAFASAGKSGPHASASSSRLRFSSQLAASSV